MHDITREFLDDFMDRYNSIKRRAQTCGCPYIYERWKAGGFRVDPDIISMYPSLVEVMEDIGLEDEEEEEDDET
jgi:hypothetical protein